MIEGVVVKDISFHKDARGWLAELFRTDETAEDMHPLMGYVSMTLPGVSRGPHEHVTQTDFFCFVGPSSFKVYLWDTRSGSKTFGQKVEFIAGEDLPKAVMVPPGVVHAYKNIGGAPGFVFNAPNSLYKGQGRKEPVDEIRYEDKPESGFILD
ncbi:MAG TPA: dTDP-4-dehydrorhamnose 3,5-epimerase family protein [Thermodesulfobacteriota bacterium]|nr:dTDP-4-dehydrorhamnose 3,5-epimerase family protein [Thermodesulfobacteriota bacterium]